MAVIRDFFKREEVLRDIDEHVLNPGESIEVKDSIFGTILAWYKMPADPEHIRYVVSVPRSLGQRLESQRGPAKVLVVDGAEGPSKN
jgi:hypothetical protein